MDNLKFYANIASELIAMAKQDQEFRFGWFKHRNDPEWHKSEALMDKDYTAQLKKIVKKIGWPTINKVGVKASHAAWLLVQHASSDPIFQHKCLKLMERAKSGTIDQRQIAYLTDRLAIAEKRPQRFGTQYQTPSSNLLPPFPLKDPDKVDQLRAKYGLGPMKPYYDVVAMEKEEKKGVNFSSLDGYKKKE